MFIFSVSNTDESYCKVVESLILKNITTCNDHFVVQEANALIQFPSDF